MGFFSKYITGEDAYREANDANQARYDQGLGILSQLISDNNESYGNAFDLMEQRESRYAGIGGDQAQSIADGAKAQRDAFTVDLNDRGLGGGSMELNAQRGAQRQRNNGLASLFGSLAELRGGAISDTIGVRRDYLNQRVGLEEQRVGFIAGRSDY